jgi:hypothetical protein
LLWAILEITKASFGLRLPLGNRVIDWCGMGRRNPDKQSSNEVHVSHLIDGTLTWNQPVKANSDRKVKTAS